jgi:hypothetical protein
MAITFQSLSKIMAITYIFLFNLGSNLGDTGGVNSESQLLRQETDTGIFLFFLLFPFLLVCRRSKTEKKIHIPV